MNEFLNAGENNIGESPNLSKFKEPVSTKLKSGTKRKPTMEEEKLKLLKLQQTFYTEENARAAEKHKLEIETIQLKNQILKVELEEKKRQIPYNSIE